VSDLLVLTLAATGTALATGLGALPVAALGTAGVERNRAALSGLAAGCMAVAAVVGLLEPGLDRGDPGAVFGGAVVGVAFLVAVRRVVPTRGAPALRPRRGNWIPVALVLLVHSLPEGFAMGTAQASGIDGLGLFAILAIALQNVPEGTATALPMQDAGYSRRAQVWTAVGTSLPQPVGAVAAFLLLDTVERLLPLSFGFAAGAMLALVVLELAPDAVSHGHRWRGGLGALIGGAAMMSLGSVAGV
jgi:ZIP family zinc transporter